jgi:NDP-sugar pyrophosphorylase family protein
VSAAPLSVRTLILAGGLGTRLRSVLPDRPKVLAPVPGGTFLDYLVAYLHGQGLRRFVFLLGHAADVVEAHLADVLGPRFPDAELVTSVEATPLDTAGAVRLADAYCTETFLLCNGDTCAAFDPAALLRAHHERDAWVTLAARRVDDAGRYGALDVDEAGRVRAFREKDPGAGAGFINAGVYAMEPRVLELAAPGARVSLERFVLPELLRRGVRVEAVEIDGPFFDIGTPASYAEFVHFVEAPR